MRMFFSYVVGTISLFVIFSAFGLRKVAATWREVEEYNDLKAIIGQPYFELLPPNLKKRLESRYTELVWRVGRFADRCDYDLNIYQFVKQLERTEAMSHLMHRLF